MHGHDDTGLVKETGQFRGEFPYDGETGYALHEGRVDDGQKEAFLDVVHFVGSVWVDARRGQ